MVGRFQPLHPGHVYLIKQALKAAQKVIIGIGSANVRNFDNPFSAEERLVWIRQMIEKQKMAGRVERVVLLNDDQIDEKWLQETLRKTGEISVVLGNNSW